MSIVTRAIMEGVERGTLSPRQGASLLLLRREVEYKIWRVKLRRLWRWMRRRS